MRTAYFTAKYISSIPFTENRQQCYYERLSGFGVRIGKTKKTYIAEMRRFLISDANIGPKRCHQ